MFHTLPTGTRLYRVTPAKYKVSQWNSKVLAGRGAFYGPRGGRYNAPGLQAAYLAEDARAAVAEGAFYAAAEWMDERFPDHFVRPITFPLVSPKRKLWCFKTTAATTAVDLEDPAARAAFGYPEVLLLNPRQAYRATQDLAGTVLTHSAPGHPNPQAGLRAPAVRSRHRSALPPPPPGTQTVLFVAAVPHSLDLEQVWDLDIEFRDYAGAAVTAGTAWVDWGQAHVTVTRPRRPAPPALNAPAGFPLGAVTTVLVSHS